jgi:hypothetical protein
MKCPHCKVEIHPAFGQTFINGGNAVGWDSEHVTVTFVVYSMMCPACSKPILQLDRKFSNQLVGSSWVIYPRGVRVSVADPSVPAELADDFNEAGLILNDSPKASAALTRTCLQTLLRLLGFAQHDLVKQIQALLDAKTLPSHLAENLDAVRNIGNFAAHPLKDTNTGAILPVEAHEAEWNVALLEGLFDFYYVQPAKDKAKMAALNAKLAKAGKPPVKQPPS